VNDHDKLRYDPALAIALERLNFINSNEADLAGKSTINRLEYRPETVIEQEKSRYHKIEHNPKEIEKTFVDIFLESYKKAPRQIILEMDVTDDQVYGSQEGAFFQHALSRSVLFAFIYFLWASFISSKTPFINMSIQPEER
jgi:hypothetical protein